MLHYCCVISNDAHASFFVANGSINRKLAIGWRAVGERNSETRGGIKRGSKYGIVSKYRKHQKHAPTTARSSASLRSSPLYDGLRCVASLRRSGLNFLFYATPGFRGFAAPPPGYFIALRGSNLGSLTLAKIPPPSPLQLPIYRAG